MLTCQGVSLSAIQSSKLFWQVDNNLLSFDVDPFQELVHQWNHHFFALRRRHDQVAAVSRPAKDRLNRSDQNAIQIPNGTPYQVEVEISVRGKSDGFAGRNLNFTADQAPRRLGSGAAPELQYNTFLLKTVRFQNSGLAVPSARKGNRANRREALREIRQQFRFNFSVNATGSNKPGD